MSQPWIVLGDKTSHGGTVIEGDPTFTTGGKPVAHVGHMTTCPRCKGGPFPIATGAPDFINNGRPVARHGDQTACGATLISGQFASFWSSERSHSLDADALISPANAKAALASQMQFDDRYALHDATSGESLANIEYAIRRASGEIEYGTTDDLGRTHLLSSIAQQEHVTIYVEG